MLVEVERDMTDTLDAGESGILKVSNLFAAAFEEELCRDVK